MKQMRFTQEEIDGIIQDYNNGFSHKELELKYHRNSGTIIGKLKSLGIFIPKRHRWSQDDIDFLKQYYPNGEWDIIFKRFPNISKNRIYTFCSENGIQSNCFWETEDEILLKENYYNIMSNNGYQGLIDLFQNKYTYSAIVSKCEKMGLKSRDYWSQNELDILKENYSFKSMSEIEKLLPKRNRKTIIMKACELGLKSKVVLETWFTDDDLLYIKNNYNKYTDNEIGKRLNRLPHAIQDQRMRFGWIKEHEESSYPNISFFLRKNNTEWKNSSADHCNNVCVITGGEYNDIHHIHSFNLIVDETLKELNIDTDRDINTFSNDELKCILTTFRKNQSKYPLGVCLSRDIHKLFHSIFGYGYNTQEQWDEFINNKYYDSCKRECYESRKN